MRKKNKSRNNFFINKLLLVCFFVMLVFSVFNIGKVVAAVDNIAITNAIIKDKITTTDASVISFDRNKIVTEVTFHKVNDYVAFELTLKNNDSKKYTIKTISDNNSDSHIVYEYDKHENEEFNSGEEKKFIIKSTYKNEVLNVNNREVQDDVEFKITFVDEDGEESDKVIPINPQTNDKIIIYGILAIISLAGLLITLKSRKVKNSLLVLLLMIPFATKAVSLSYQFDFKTDIEYFDKMVVTVDRNGTKEQIIVPYGEKMSAPEVVTIPGYNFIGYYDGDNEVDFNSNITEDTNITAKYETITYNISYDLDDGTVATANPLTYTVEDEFTLNNPTKQGFEFAGWTGTGLDGLTTSVKINKGTTEDLSFTANYTAGTSTSYKVIHKYQDYNLTTYTDEEQSLTGVTGTTVYPQIRHKDGFIDPTVTGVMIKADGTAKLEYTYQRDSFTYSFDTNVTSSKEAGTYLFETEITVSPKEVQGYIFSNWEDGSTDNPRTISLSENTNVVPTYVPRDDTQYTIHHCYKNLNDGCDTTDVVGHGTTGQTIEAPRVPKTGFVTPDAANITILADGTAELTYTYNRETYTFAVGENITSTKVNGTYPYGTEITVTATPAAGYTFSKWEDNSTINPRAITLTKKENIVATFTANTDTAYTVYHQYETVDGSYETDTKVEHGTTDQTVEVPRYGKTGFVLPTAQNVTIAGDGSSEITYTYNRETYTFAVGENITSTKVNGTYRYGTEITVTANEVAGYTFNHWEDNSVANPRTITLTENTSVVATFDANTDTAYTVHHKYQTLNNTYETEDATEHGTTGQTVNAPIRHRDGFEDPEVAQVTITGDGLAEVTYTYNREIYAFSVTDRTYLTSSSTANGTYMYGTQISVTANTRAGYTFEWNDGDTSYSKEFELTGATTLTPNYTPNTDTAYTVYHYKQQINGGYVLVSEDTDHLTGTTDTNVTPATKSYTGFTAPSTQTDSINGDGSTEFSYYYTRNKYNLTVLDSEYVLEDKTGEYYYEEEVTLTRINREGYTFTGWSNGETTDQITITIGTEDISIKPEYEINNYSFSVGENITSTKVNGNYPYGTEITVIATPAVGYTFVKWEDNSTTNPRTITLTDDLSVSATFTANDDTEYTVHHRYQQLDNTYNTVDVTETGTTDTTVTAPLRSQTGYVDPTTEQVTIFGDGSAEVTYTYNRETYTFAIGDHVTSTLAPGTYMYGTTITVTADTRQGYTFTEWENGITTASRVIVLASDITAVATYSNNTDTPYTVNHYKQQLDGTYPSVADDTDSLTGTTEASVTPATNTYTGFTSPATQTKQIMGDGTTTFTYNYTRNKYNLILTNTDYIQEGDISDEYYYEEEIELHALPKTGYTFAGWSDGENIIENSTTITISMGTEDVTVGPTYTINSYTITFETQGGTPQPSAIVITYNNEVGSLPDNVEKEGFTFAGWYDDPDGGTLITASTLVTDDDTYYAHWDEIIIPSIICKKAVSLNTETCNQTSTSKYCSANGHSNGDTITYGNIIRSDTYTAGDAFDCNVDGTGYNQRFYYIRTLDNKAVLINNKNFTAASGQEDQDTSGIYTWADDQLPTTSEWNNVSVTFGDKAARLITKDDIIAMTGVANITNLSGNWSLGNYEFLFENSNYSGIHQRSTQWIEQWTEDSTNKRARYRNDQGNVAVLSSSDAGTSKNPVRPVIEVPLVSIEDDYIVRYDPMNGSLSNQYVRVAKGDSLGTLPTPTQSGWEFLGWYDSNQFTSPITASHTPVGYETYYAKYVKSVGSSQLTYDSFELEENDTDTITFDNQADVEPRTYASSDDTIVTVDASGNITALAQGTATITITGAISNTTKTVTVTVIVPSPYYYITFDVDGGESLAELPVTKNTAAGSLPATTKTNYTFGGWFTTTDFTTEVTAETIITKNMTVHAKWIPDDAVAEVNNNTFYTTLQDAIDEAPTTKSTVKLLKNVEVTTPIDMVSKNTDKDIILDLNGYTLSTASSAASKTNVIKTKAKLEVKNGTISSSKNDALIDVEGNTSYLVLRENINLVSTGGRACVYNTGGNALIEGNATLTSNAEWTSSMKRGTVQTLNSGTTTIKGGTIINNRASASYAVAIQLGTVTIGTKDGIYDIDNLVIQGETNGIYADVDYSLYDGLVKGKTAAVNDENKIANEEDNMTRVNDEVGGYKRLYYQTAVSKIKITLNSNGGSGTPDFITVDEGDPVAASDITTPTKGVYTFTGWYYDAELQNPVTFPFTPTASIPLYAGWSYVVDPTPVVFNMTNDVMEEYFTNINTWKTQYTVSGTKTDESGYTEVLNTTEFDTTMRTNFDAHNCSACGTSASQNNCSSPLAGDYCERPKGYDTGQNEVVDVYEYDSSTDTSTLITYTTSDTGVIYNMIPGKVYKWVSTSDSNIYGYVEPTATSGRRTIYSTARNVRDLGGMEVSFTRGNTTKTGTIKYGKLYRGAQLSGGQTDVNSLTKLGITREVDLRVQTEGTNPVRLPKHDKCDGNCGTLSSAEDIIITNYRIYPTYGNGDNYAALRDAMKYVMQSVVDGDNIYFHCTIGTDRTGTLAYFLEGLLGVSEEDKLEDYELTYFYGLLNRTRFHDNLSGSSINPRFLSMYKTYDTNEKIYNFYMYGLTEEQIAEENVLIEQFRDAMIDYTN